MKCHLLIAFTFTRDGENIRMYREVVTAVPPRTEQDIVGLEMEIKRRHELGWHPSIVAITNLSTL